MLKGRPRRRLKLSGIFDARARMFTGLSDTDDTGVCERVIAHLDLDCFYAQVERVRLSIPFDKPLAVQQWGALIAGAHIVCAGL